jgi:hypothetical protein
MNNKMKSKQNSKQKSTKNSILDNNDDMRSCNLEIKKTLHGVKSESTKEMFKELKKRGFNSGLEKGGANTFKIISFINGVDFIISCVDGADPKYTKSYSRSKRDWASFVCIDDLIKTTFIKRDNPPTDAQISFFKTLVGDIASLSNAKPKIKIPKTVMEMSQAIDICVKYKDRLRVDNSALIESEFISITKDLTEKSITKEI